MEINIESQAFHHQEAIPQKYTCEGSDVSPPLSLSNIPEGTKALAIIVDDPDAPVGVFVHWVAWNFPPDKTSLEEGESEASQGMNDFRVNGYRGPCPPPGSPHRYFFKVYALDTELSLPEGSTKEDLLKAMEGHILTQGELIGTYQR